MSATSLDYVCNWRGSIDAKEQAKARAELAALRAIIKEQEQDIANIKAREAAVVENYRATVAKQDGRLAEQARALTEARELLEYWFTEGRFLVSSYDKNSEYQIAIRALQSWLSAHPAPSAATEKPRASAECPCIAAERPVKPCYSGCWHFTPDDGHRCVNCGQPSAAEPQPYKIVTLLGQMLDQMIRIGNALNWEPPIDQAYADAINAIRAALQAEQEPQP